MNNRRTRANTLARIGLPLCLTLLAGLIPSLSRAAELLLIIDDVGYNRKLGEQAVALPAPVNLAFLPHTPFAARLAEKASDKGHVIMLHAPMDNEQGAKLGPGGLHGDMDQHTLQQVLLDDLESIPHVQGFNNHTGSLLTQNPQAMNWVMEIARQQGLFFIDSLTSAASVARQKADANGVPALDRDVFLDNLRDEESLSAQFERAVALAQKRGYAVIIGHPYPETLAFLHKALPALEPRNVRLTSIDQFLRQRLWSRLIAPEPAPSRYLLHSSPIFEPEPEPESAAEIKAER
ncbi:divergent polysaccharide deacetylase family protein [Thalassolituus sp. UBA6592]|uniref:divergent polysaccharide deacetylase family protein n=3 Tax=unclassified Thalassolituus TaxID=2624967 RepID=UPI0025F61F4F|nr:divergent polysaccharide deacetylase family protein [Thalassolituus sp. UBA6592]